MKPLVTLFLLLSLAATAGAAGKAVSYQVNGEPFEGYFVSPAPGAPLVLLIHDWDGLNDYEVKRSEMLAAMGYAVFAADLFGKGVRPAGMEDRRRLTGAG
jgi:dienelactone hydrolase